MASNPHRPFEILSRLRRPSGRFTQGFKEMLLALSYSAVACLVLGCAWTLHANVFGAGVYPRLSSANFDAAVIRPPAIAVRSALSPAETIAASLPEPAPVISAPASAPPLLSFDDRFAA